MARTCASSISVGANGTLVGSHGAILPKLSIDAADTGKIKGFAFTENGRLDVTGMIVPGGMALPTEFENVEGLENLSQWTLTVNGQAGRGYSAKAVRGRLVIFRRGMVVTFK